MVEKVLDMGSKNPFIFIIILLFAIPLLCFIVAVFKYTANKGGKINILGSEIDFSNNKENNSEKSESVKIEKPLEQSTNFLSTISSIIDLSIQEGYQGAVLRRELYDSQMEYIRSRFEGIQSQIIYEYMKNNNDPHTELSELLLKCAFNPIIDSLRHICIKDRLNEKTLQAVLETNKNLIEMSVNRCRNELIKPIRNQANKDLLLKCFDNQAMNIEQGVQVCIKHAHEDACSFFNRLSESHINFQEKIATLIAPFAKKEVAEKIVWDIQLPPNKIVGDS